jgi:hypothetical protein
MFVVLFDPFGQAIQDNAIVVWLCLHASQPQTINPVGSSSPEQSRAAISSSLLLPKESPKIQNGVRAEQCIGNAVTDRSTDCLCRLPIDCCRGWSVCFPHLSKSGCCAARQHGGRDTMVSIIHIYDVRKCFDLTDSAYHICSAAARICKQAKLLRSKACYSSSLYCIRDAALSVDRGRANRKQTNDKTDNK